MMMREAVSTGNAAVDAERFETLSDINTACVAAVDILNDLLSFDKMESGILELHTEEVAGLPFVKESIAMFTVHARSKGIAIVTDFASDSDEESKGEAQAQAWPLTDVDMISLDKFKVSQVIRNLVSNALKFTPSGGRVTVKAYFEPSATAPAVPVPVPTVSAAPVGTRSPWRVSLSGGRSGSLHSVGNSRRGTKEMRAGSVSVSRR